MVGLLLYSTRAFVVFLLALLLTACGASSTAGFNTYQSPDGRYGFLYPMGWTRVSVNGGPQVVFHDLINSDETLSLVVSEVSEGVDIETIGSPEAVGERLIREVIAPEGTGRAVELVKATERESSDHVFYDLEYVVHLSDRDRHELATVVIDRGYLYTLATGTTELRWNRVEKIFENIIYSFTFLI